MTADAPTIAFAGIDCLDIDVQVQVASGLPAFTIVGPITHGKILDAASGVGGLRPHITTGR